MQVVLPDFRVTCLPINSISIGSSYGSSEPTDACLGYPYLRVIFLPSGEPGHKSLTSPIWTVFTITNVAGGSALCFDLPQLDAPESWRLDLKILRIIPPLPLVWLCPMELRAAGCLLGSPALWGLQVEGRVSTTTSLRISRLTYVAE